MKYIHLRCTVTPEGKLGTLTLKVSHECKSIKDCVEVWSGRMYTKNEIEKRRTRARGKTGEGFWTINRKRWLRNCEADRWRGCKSFNNEFKYKRLWVLGQ